MGPKPGIYGLNLSVQKPGFGIAIRRAGAVEEQEILNPQLGIDQLVGCDHRVDHGILSRAICLAKTIVGWQIPAMALSARS
ncbi:MAG: hypothetical protein RL367_449 [Pseudomonadota bacterium]